MRFLYPPLILSILLTNTIDAGAQCHTVVVRRPRVVEIVHETPIVPVVVAPVAVPVAIPVTFFQYFPTTTLASAVPAVYPQSSQPALTSQPTMDAAAIDNLIRARLAELLAEKHGASIDDPPPLTFDEPAKIENVKSAKTELWLSSMKLDCGRCHTQGSTVRGNVILFNSAGIYNPNVSDASIRQAILSDAMPKGRKLNNPTKKLLLSGL